jgi:Domain of unknown function (DUF4190)
MVPGMALGGSTQLSDASQGEGWWLASDGKWYPPESATPPPPPAPPARGSGSTPVAPVAAAPQRTNSLAITSLVLGILGFVSCAIAGIPGLITGVIARRQIRESAGVEGGDGLATAGIVTSIISLVLVGGLVLVLVAVTLLGSEASSKFSQVASAIR